MQYSPREGDADLCAQWAAVQAVEESNRLTRISLRVNGLEFGALLLSLIFTGWAAIAAAKAANIAEEATRDADRALEIANRNAAAADEQVKIARQSSELQLRPYLECADILFVFERTQAASMTLHSDHRLELTIRNFGQTPARDTSIECWWVLADDPLDLSIIPPDQKIARMMGDIAPSGWVTLRLPIPKGLDAIRKGERKLSCAGLLTFLDGAENLLRAQFAYQGGPEIFRVGQLERAADAGNRTYNAQEVAQLLAEYGAEQHHAPSPERD